MIDLRTLAPYDWEAIARRSRKTSRAHGGARGLRCRGATARRSRRASATSCSTAWTRRCGRVGALDTWVGYHPQLEDAILPQVENLAAEMEKLLSY